jgi:hypothetical protein
MRTSTAAFLAAALLAGCSRDLSVPPANRIAFAQPFRTAAPRQLLGDLQVSGGAGGYVFSFAQGGRLSGDDATVDASTGVYRAGGRGSAQDLVQVTDASGATAIVRISVGAPLSVSPPIGGTAPGGQLAFTVSGGLAPYAVTVAVNASGAAQPTLSGASFGYTAGATGAVIDGIRVTDATGDPAAVATVEVSVGIALGAFPSARTVAPYDSATVVGTGGAPPYTYGVRTKRSGPEASITATGFYTAGGAGNVDDEILITDSNGTQVSFFMHVGPPLTLVLDGAPPDPRPGVPTGLLAAGGKPPYAYRFARGGNRSSGTVDGTTGAYVPGPASGAVDLFEVTDQTGKALARISNATAVGATQLPTGSLNRVCAAGDLDGDGVDDVLVANDGFTRLGALRRIAGTPRFDSYPMSNTSGETSFLAVEDLNGDGRAEVLLRTVDGPVLSFFPDALGQLNPGPTWTYNNTPTPPSLVVPVHEGGAIPWRANRTWFASSMAGGNCPAGTVSSFQWDATSVFMSSCPSAPGYGGGGWIAGLAAADVDGDGYQDLVYLQQPGGSNTTDGELYVAYGNASGNFDAVVVATTVVPAGYTWAYQSDWNTPYARFHAVPAAAGQIGGVLLRVEDANGRGAIVTARVTPGARTWAVNGPYDLRPGWPGVWGLVAAPRSPLQGAEPLYVGYDLVDGHLLGVVLDPIGLLPHLVAIDPGPRASRIDCVAFPDANADGAPDLVAVGQFMQTSDLLLGSGDSTVPRPDTSPWFGGRVHQRGVGFPSSLADVDGDGLVDLVAWDGSGLSVYLGGDGQLGMLQRLSTQLVFGSAEGPLFAPQVAGTTIVFHDQQQTFYAALPDGNGGFQPAFALTVTKPGGAAYAGQVYGFQYAQFGGPAMFAQGAVFLPRGAGNLLAVPMAAHPSGESIEKCNVIPARAYPDPAAIATVFMTCAEPRAGVPGSNECDLAIYQATATGLGGASPAFSAWTQVDRWSNPSTSDQLVVMNALFGSSRLLDGGAYFAAFDTGAQAYRIVTFNASLAPVTQVLSLPGVTASKGIGGGAVPVTLRPGPDDLLLPTNAGTLLLRRTAVGQPFTVVQRLKGGMQSPVGAGPLVAGQPPYVITVGPGLFAGDSGTEVVVVPTDGTYVR